jgi:hypothetical protein
MSAWTVCRSQDRNSIVVRSRQSTGVRRRGGRKFSIVLGRKLRFVLVRDLHLIYPALFVQERKCRNDQNASVLLS